jgi:hypothetical protein
MTAGREHVHLENKVEGFVSEEKGPTHSSNQMALTAGGHFAVNPNSLAVIKWSLQDIGLQM